jgi:tetratricopeptide (TPR) repeat protein/membrane associated rhomboid family serine protease
MIPDPIEFQLKPVEQEYGFRSFGRLRPCTREELLARFSGWGSFLPPRLVWAPDHARLVPPVEWPPLVESIRRIRLWRWGLLLGLVLLVLLLLSIVMMKSFSVWKGLPARHLCYFILQPVLWAVVPLFWVVRRFQDLRLASPEEVAGVGASPRLVAWMSLQRPKAWLWIAGALLVVFGIQLIFGFWASLSAAALDDQSVRLGEYWRLLSGPLLHLGSWHFVVNLMGIVVAAWLIEVLARRWVVLLTFVVTALAGSIARLSQAGDDLSAGASGAAYGLFGFICVLSWIGRRQVPGLWKVCLWFLALDALAALGMPHLEMNNLSHGVGLITGAILAGVLVPRLEAIAPRRARIAGIAATVALGAGVLGVLLPTALKHNGIWGLHDRGWRASKKGNHEAAIRYFSQILDRDPRNRIGYAGRAASLNSQEDFEGALRDYESWLKFEPSHSDALIGRAGTFRRMGHYARALDDLDRVLKSEPRNSMAFADRAETRLYSGNLQGALKDAHEACSLSPLDFDDLVSSARFIGGEEFNDRVQSGGHARYVLGLVRTALADYDGAIADFWEVLRFDQEYARSDLGEALRLKGELDAALNQFELCLKEFTDDPDSLLGRARIRIARGEVEAGRADLEKALKSAGKGWRLRSEAEKLLAELPAK